MLPNASPAEQRAYQQGFHLGIKQPLGTGLSQKTAPPLAIRHDQTLLNAFEQGYRVGLQQPRTSRYQGLIPWVRLRQLIGLMLVVLAGLLVVTLMVPDTDNTANTTHRVTQAASAGVESVSDPQIATSLSAIPSELDDFSLLTPAERFILSGLPATKTIPNTPVETALAAAEPNQKAFLLLLDEHGAGNLDPCHGIFIWPAVHNPVEFENLRVIWIFDGLNSFTQKRWQEVFFPHTIGEWEVLLIKNDIPQVSYSFYYGGNTLELFE